MLKRGPFAGGLPSRSSLSMLRFRFRSGESDIEGDRSPSRGIGIPVSSGFVAKEGDGGELAA